MSIISDDIWDKFEFEDSQVETLLASFSTTHSMDEELIKTETDDWLEDKLDKLPVDLVKKMGITSSEQLLGYDDASNSLCPDCMWNGNCVRKKSKFNYNTAHVKGLANGVNAVRKLNFDVYENNNIKFINPKICAFEDEKAHWMEQFDFGLVENDEAQPQLGSKKRKKSLKTGPKIVAKKQRGKIGNLKQEKNNNVDLYCYEKFNEKSLLWNNDLQRNADNKTENVKLKSTAIVRDETDLNEQLIYKSKLGYRLNVDDKTCEKILKHNVTLSPVVKKIELNNGESPRVCQSVKNFNFNDDQQSKTKLEIMNCYEIKNLFDDKDKNQQIQVDTLDVAATKHFNVGAKSRNTRKEKDLRNQRDRERKKILEKGYRELSQLVPELSLPQSKHLTVAHKREILQKTAQYCSDLVNRNLDLKKEKEYENKKNIRLLETFMFLSSG